MEMGFGQGGAGLAGMAGRRGPHSSRNRVPVRRIAVLLCILFALLAGGIPGRDAGAETPVQSAALAGRLPAGMPDRVVDARIGLHAGGKTRFVLELSRALPWRATVEADPWRLVVDLPPLILEPGALPPPRGLFTRLGGSQRDGRLSFQLETRGPARIDWAALLPPQDGRGPRLVVDVSPVQHHQFLRQIEQGGDWSSLPSAPAASATHVALTGAAPAPAAVAASLPRFVPAAVSGMGNVPVPRQKPVPPARPVIVIDPGHGGQDPGAVAVNGVHEKDVTLAMAGELRRQLLATGRYQVFLTREDDRFIRLRDRVALARGWNADLFISLHADSIGRREVRGLSVYTLSDTASDREAEMLAQRENRADAIVGLDLSNEAEEVVGILIDLAQRSSRNESRRFAGLVVEEAGRSVALLNRPLRSAGFAVLTAPDVPSVLVEMGYLSSPKDAKLLSSPRHQEKLAGALVRAIHGHFSPTLVAGRR